MHARAETMIAVQGVRGNALHERLCHEAVGGTKQWAGPCRVWPLPNVCLIIAPAPSTIFPLATSPLLPFILGA